MYSATKHVGAVETFQQEESVFFTRPPQSVLMPREVSSHVAPTFETDAGRLASPIQAQTRTSSADRDRQQEAARPTSVRIDELTGSSEPWEDYRPLMPKNPRESSPHPFVAGADSIDAVEKGPEKKAAARRLEQSISEGPHESQREQQALEPGKRAREQEVLLEDADSPLMAENVRPMTPPGVFARLPASPGKEVRTDMSRRRELPETEMDDIQIHIGRIEVTAVPQASARPAPDKPVRKAANLDEYLRRRDGRAS